MDFLGIDTTENPNTKRISLGLNLNSGSAKAITIMYNVVITASGYEPITGILITAARTYCINIVCVQIIHISISKKNLRLI